MPLKATDYTALRELRDAAQAAWKSARLLRATSGVDLTRSDMAMQRLHAAAQAVERVDLSAPAPVSRKAKAR